MFDRIVGSADAGQTSALVQRFRDGEQIPKASPTRQDEGRSEKPLTVPQAKVHRRRGVTAQPAHHARRARRFAPGHLARTKALVPRAVVCSVSGVVNVELNRFAGGGIIIQLKQH